MLVWLFSQLLMYIQKPIQYLYFKITGFPFRWNWKIYGFPLIRKKRNSQVLIGERLILTSTNRSNSMGIIQPVIIRCLNSDAIIEIGNNVGISGSSIISTKKIKIGSNVLIGSGVVILDSDMHPVNYKERLENLKAVSSPVIIEDDVFIGARSIILKGVTIGEGSVIGAGSVVTTDIAPYSIACGNPAVIIKHIEYDNI